MRQQVDDRGAVNILGPPREFLHPFGRHCPPFRCPISSVHANVGYWQPDVITMRFARRDVHHDGFWDTIPYLFCQRNYSWFVPQQEEGSLTYG